MLLKVAALAAAVHAAAAFSPLAARLPRARRSARLTTAVPIAGAGREAAPTDLTLGAPAYRPRDIRYTTEGGVEVTRTVKSIQDGALEIEHMVTGLDSARGCVFASSYEFPGRYTRWTIGFLDPPLEVVGRKDQYTVTALNPRGTVLLPAILAALKRCAAVSSVQYDARGGEQGCGFLVGAMAPRVEVATEEERSKQPSIMSLVRAIKELFSHDEEPQLGLYGAFGYDITFQFEPVELAKARPDTQRDLVLYLPDRLVVVDKVERDAWELNYEFTVGDTSTFNLPRFGTRIPYEPLAEDAPLERRELGKGDFAAQVVRAKEQFKVGNLFEAVLSQTFRERSTSTPSELFKLLRARNPSPYGFLINLGGSPQEYLVGASPEMFVRCESTSNGIRVETCPISGTIARGKDALEDAAAIREILASAKEESELTMCTDVDRNDKSRICVPGSVRVLGRRQIEMYSRLIHTVDHVEGYLRPGFDALDAFLCHTWAVTVTGAPKTWAMRFVEKEETSPRVWYGGAVGYVGFDGSMNTGLTLRTIRVVGGVGEVRAGATLLFDSDPAAEEAETELKASALIDVLTRPPTEDEALALSAASFGADGALGANAKGTAAPSPDATAGPAKHILLVDHEDSFVHTLGNYLRQTGASVVTTRAGDMFRQKLAALIAEGAKPDLVVLSPGPGTPTDFDLKGTMAALQEHEIPAFGVCLGLQGMVETFGGTLGVLDYPMHGKPSEVTVTAPPGESAKWGIFDGLPPRFTVARYHSLYGERDKLPACLRPTAETDDGVVMAIEHRTLPYAAVQFHPESILTADTNGLRMLSNALKHLKWPGAAGAGAAAVAAAAAAAPPSPARPATITVPGAAAPAAPAAPAVPAASPGAGAAEALARLTVPKLKELCGSQGLRKSGKKADLVARLVAQGAAAY